ncbi:hypothetical protein [Arthrobacter celericrescens]|uniref:hypothetical protein n=1 Tax=Arthrobacter celericrescens TaxID=2320851 RepID=UPI003CCB4DEC
MARTAQLRKAGFSKGDLSKGLQDGRLNLIRRGVFAVEDPDRAILAAVQANAKLTCISASPFYGLWSLREPGTLHLSCGNGLPKPSVVDHSACTHPVHPYLPVAGLADVLLHALRCLPELEALVMVQSAVSQGGITVDFLRRKLPGNRNGAARSVLELVIPRADSLTEVLARTHFLRAGHLEPRQVKKDQRRNNAALRVGLLPLRFYYDDVVHHPERMVAQVLAVLRRRESGGFGPGQPSPFLPDPD